MITRLRVLMLLTDGFGGIGGIAKFNRDFLEALNRLTLVERVHALPRTIPVPIEGVIPEFVVYDRKAARGKFAYMLRAAAHVLRNEPVHLVICGHIHLLQMAWLSARLFGARLVLVIHGRESWTPSHRGLSNLLAHHVDAFIAVSKFSAERFSRWSGLSLNRAFILPNCVDIERFKPQTRDVSLVNRYGLQSSKVILTVGRLATDERYKGFDQLIEALPQLRKRFPNLKYLIVGDGNDRARLQAKARALCLSDSVIFAGYVPETEKVAHYNLADVFAMPSTGEGFGIVLLEAAACGIPIVGSQIDGSREALLNGELGCLIDPRNPSAIVEALSSALASEKPLKQRDMVKAFSLQNFNVRVADWCRAQVACISAN